MNISYKSVTYFGKQKKNLHFTDLKVDDKNYGDLVIAIDTTLGSQLNNYCLQNEGAIEIELTGEDIDLIQLNSDDLVQSITDTIYNIFDTVAQAIKGCQNSAELLAMQNSIDFKSKCNAILFNAWRSYCVDVLNTSIDDYTNKKVDSIDVDTIKNKFPFCENGVISLPFVTSDDDPRTLTDIENEAKRILEKGDAPIQNIDELKASKLSDITAITSRFDNQLVNTDMIINSSLGFKVNADLRSQNNIRGLIAVGIEPVNFIDANNQVQSLTIEQLNTLLNECALNGQSLYLQKWSYKAQIEACKSIEELNAIEFNFTMRDFNDE